MNFKSNEEVSRYVSYLTYLEMGSQGTCYYRKRYNDVLKLFNFFDDRDYKEEKTSEQILRFSQISNSTFIWPSDIITVNDKVVGYIAPYVNARNLYKLNPLSINLDILTKAIIDAYEDIRTISQNGIETYDMMYNILYSRKFRVIDQDEYSIKDIDSKKLEEINNQNFNYEIYFFLIDNYFNNIVNDSKLLKELYKDKKEDILVFLKLLRERLSELSDQKITYLRDAKQYADKDAGKGYKEYIRFK